MAKTAFKHSDCRNFIPIDVAKGICGLINQNVLIDTQVCPKFKEVAKCKNCSNFKDPDEKMIGRCAGFNDDYWAYGDLKSVLCEKYQAK